MYNLSEIRTLHLEITTFCNLRCPQCPRNLNGGEVNPNLPTAEIRLDDIAAMFPPEFIRQLSLMYLCGNYGDAVVARDTLPVFEHFRNVNPGIRLELYTNGSGRDPQWWERLAQTIDRCVFAIDGLADTNQLYRRGASWEMIVRSAKAFIGAGGNAHWTFIPFRHNEHQIAEAKSVSQEIGFSRFRVKPTARFSGEDSFPVYGRTDTVEYHIRPAEISAPARPTSDVRLWSCEIHCKAAAERMLYVSAEGLVFPCCWLGLLYRAPGDLGSMQFTEMLQGLPGGIESINAKRRPLSDILQGRLFQDLIPGAWVPDCKRRLRTCARICGVYPDTK